MRILQLNDSLTIEMKCMGTRLCRGQPHQGTLKKKSFPQISHRPGPTTKYQKKIPIPPWNVSAAVAVDTPSKTVTYSIMWMGHHCVQNAMDTTAHMIVEKVILVTPRKVEHNYSGSNNLSLNWMAGADGQ